MSDEIISPEVQKFIHEGWPVPKHVAFINDGHRRWLEENNKPFLLAHLVGARKCLELLRVFAQIGIKYSTFYYSSTENHIHRPREMKWYRRILMNTLDHITKEYINKGFRINIIGNREILDEKFLNKIINIEEESKHLTNHCVNIAVHFGGRWDIVNAAKKMVVACQEDPSLIDKIDEAYFSQFLSLYGQPSPDLCIRTSGVMRLSNYLLWDMAYTDLVSTEKKWPDFTVEDFLEILKKASKIERRFGR